MSSQFVSRAADKRPARKTRNCPAKLLRRSVRLGGGKEYHPEVSVGARAPERTARGQAARLRARGLGPSFLGVLTALGDFLQGARARRDGAPQGGHACAALTLAALQRWFPATAWIVPVPGQSTSSRPALAEAKVVQAQRDLAGAEFDLANTVVALTSTASSAGARRIPATTCPSVNDCCRSAPPRTSG